MKNKIFSSIGVLTGMAVLLISILVISPEARDILLRNITQTGSNQVNAPAKPLEIQRTSSKTLANAAEAPEFPAVPSVVFKDGAGNTIDISKQKGKVLFINFWATWCPPCRAEMPSINKLKAEMKGKDILFLMVDVDNNYKKARKFMDNKKYDLPVYTPAGDIPSEFLSGSIPSTVIVDKQGRVVGRHQGEGDYTRPEVIKFFKDLSGK